MLFISLIALNTQYLTENVLVEHLNNPPTEEEMKQYAENAKKAEEAKAAAAKAKAEAEAAKAKAEAEAANNVENNKKQRRKNKLWQT